MVSPVVNAGSNSNSPFYRDTTERENFFNKKNAKLTKLSHDYKGY